MKTKLLSCILLSAMALGATQAFAQKLDAPVAAKEDLMTFAGVEYQVSVDDKGEKNLHHSGQLQRGRAGNL